MARRTARKAAAPAAKPESARAQLIRESGAVRKADPSQLTLAIDGNRNALTGRMPVAEYQIGSDSATIPLAPSSNPSSIVSVNPRARNQARYARRNDAWITGLVDQLAKNVVGSGPVPATKDRVLARNWKRASDHFDSTGMLDFGSLLRDVIYTGFLTDAESFVRIDFIPQDGVDDRGFLTFQGTPTPVRLKAMTPEYCPEWYSNMTEPWPTPSVVVDGIGLDRENLDRRLYYMLYRQHPYDSGLMPYSPYLAEPVPADRVCHLMKPGMAGSRRGMNRMTPILIQAQQLADYNDSELRRKQLSNALCFFIYESPDSSGEGNLPGEYDPETGQPIGGNGFDVDSLRSQVDISSCGITKLPAGMKVEIHDPKGTPETDSWFVKQRLQAFCAAWGMPSFLVNMELDGLSDRAMKFAMEAFMPTLKGERKLCERQVLNKVWRAYVMGEYFSGRWAPTPGTWLEDYMDPEWDWPIVHTAQLKDDLKILMAAAAGRFVSKGFVTKNVLGKDAEQMAIEIALEAARDQALGFAPEFETIPTGQMPIPAWSADASPLAKAIAAAVAATETKSIDLDNVDDSPALPELV